MMGQDRPEDAARRWLDGVEAAADRWATRTDEIPLEEWQRKMTAHAHRMPYYVTRHRGRYRYARVRRYFRQLGRALAGREE